MSRKLFAFLLSELSMIRVICKCGNVVETPIEKLAACYPVPKCHFCKEEFAVGGYTNFLDDLSKIISAAKIIKPKVDFEFFIPELSE